MALYLLVILISHIPVGQSFIGEQTSSILSEKLGTEVEVGQVSLGFLNRIIIDNVRVQDQDKRELLKVGRLAARVDLLPLTQGRISISSIQLFGAKIQMRRADAQSPTNFQFILDALASKDSTSHSPLDLRINSIIIRHSSIIYDQEDVPKTLQFNPKHLDIEELSSHIILKILSDDSLNINVKRIAFKEKSKLEVKRLSFRFVAGKKTAHLNDFNLQLPHSHFQIDNAIATFEKDLFKETLKYKVDSIKSTINPRDLACFYNDLKSISQNFNLTTSIQGTGTAISIPELLINTPENNFQFRVNAWAKEFQQPHPRWQATIHDLIVAPSLVETLKRNFDEIPHFVTNLEKIKMTGQFGGYEDGGISIHSSLITGVGDIRLNFQQNGDKDHSFTGSLKSKDMNLEKILENPDFGSTSTDLHIVGNKSYANIKGNVAQFEYKDYNYKDITINGKFLTNELIKGFDQRFEAEGLLSIDDPNIQTKIEGSCRKVGRQLMAQLQGDVSNISPKALHLSDNWGDAVFSGTFKSDFKASNLNDAEGTVTLQDFSMKDSTELYAIHQLHLESGYQEGVHFLKMNGDMGDAALTGQFDWNTLPQSFINMIGSRLPTLPGLPKMKKNVNNDFDIKVNLNNTDWLQRLLHIPFLIYQPITVNASVNDADHDLNINANIPSFTYNGDSYHNANIYLVTPQDSIICKAGVTKLMDDESSMQMDLNAKAYDNQLTTNINWDNHSKDDYNRLSGEINALAQLYTDEHGKPEAYLHIMPSHTIMNGAKWNVMPCDIFYTEENLNIERFSVEHGQQHLTINGVASRQESDTLKIDLKDVDVEYVLDLVNFHSVSFKGLATGKAYLTQPFDSLAAKADLIVKDFLFENGRMGTLNAQASWNNKDKQIDIHAIANDEPDANTVINGYVSPIRSDIKLDIQAQGTYIDFTKTYTESFLDNLTGHAYGNVQLVGPLSEMDLLGKLIVNGRALVKPLGTTYTMKNDTLYFVKNDIQIRGAEIQDKFLNSAFITGGVHHENLSNLTFDLEVETSRLLAYDFDDYGNEVFHGHIVAGGKVDLHGYPGEIIINCNVTPLRTSVFHYNAASTDAVSNQEFISWNEKVVDTLNIAHVHNTLSDFTDIPSDLYINFLINTTPEANLRLLMDSKTNDYISLYGSGVIRATYHNKGAFNMYGTYRVSRGTYGLTIQNFIKKNFNFSDGGTIVFGGNPMNANLNLQASHTVNGVSLSDLNMGESFSNNTIRVNCLMNILGQAGAPRIEFDLDLLNVNSEEKQMIRSIIASDQEMNQQVIYLLGIGRFYTQGVNNANTNQEYGQTQLAMQSFLSGTLSSQINAVISDVIKNDNWNFGANISTGNEGWHNAEYEGLISGSLLNNRLLINGQFGYRDNARQATPSFIGDFDIRYLLQPNGNLALKVYNQTNDRYFTRSSLNTQGIGLIIKKDFNHIGELFQRRKKN